MADDERNERFLRLYTEHQRRLHSYIGTLLTNAADIDEVLQETSIVLWRKFDQFDASGDDAARDFFRWSASVAHFEVLRYCRKRKHELLLLDEAVIDLLAEERIEMSDQLEAELDALESCISKLAPRDRDLVGRCYAKGAKTVEVAEQLGRPANSVYLSLGRIRKSLLACITRTLSGRGRS